MRIVYRRSCAIRERELGEMVLTMVSVLEDVMASLYSFW